MTTKFLIKVLAFGVFVGMMTGCVTPAGETTCELKPGDTYRYICEDGTARCAWTGGAAKYVDCRMPDGVYCVEDCK